MIINSCTVNQHGQNMLQLHVSMSCPFRRQAIVILLANVQIVGSLRDLNTAMAERWAFGRSPI
jgi:hypothetical protein